MIDTDLQFSLNRRFFILGGIKGALTASLIGRLYFLQSIKSEHYQLLSDKNRIQTRLLAPSRGLIFDRKNILLASNKIIYRTFLMPELTKNPVLLLNNVCHYLNLSQEMNEFLLKRFKKNKRQPLLIKEDLSWEELATLELHTPSLQGILIEKGERRYYNYPELFSHSIGYVSYASSKEKDDNPLFSLPGFRTGKSNLELAYNQKLQGDAGVKNVEVNAYGQIVRTLETYTPKKGGDLQLTLSQPLQSQVAQIISSQESAGAIVLEAHTGEILAFVSHPSFNSQLFTDSLSKKDWLDLTSHPRKPLMNKLTQGLYAPGSIFKIVVALAALEEKIITPTTAFHCPGHYDFHGHRFYCWNWKRGGHGHVTVQSALAQSCDTFFYSIATKLGVDTIAAYAKAFGYGDLTGIEIPGEKMGIVPTKSWKEKIKKKPWTPGETINISIGQGYLLSTPLQQAKCLAMLINGLKPINIHFIQGNEAQDKDLLKFQKENVELVLKGLEDVVNKPFGTAYGARIWDEDFLMGGKTASTQVSRITEEQRRLGTHNDRPYHLREHAMFVGYAPLHNPKYVVSIIVEHGGSAARVAAPLARDIFLALKKLEKEL